MNRNLYVTFFNVSDNISSAGQEFDLFSDSTIAQLFISSKAVDTTSILTKLFMINYGGRYYFEPISLENNEINFNDIYSKIKANIKVIDFLYTYKYKKLLATLNFDYNPIWNKDGKIVHEYKRTPNLTTENTSNSSTVIKNENVEDLTSNIKNERTPNVKETTTSTGDETVTPDTTTTTTQTPFTTTHSTSPYDTSATLYPEYSDATTYTGSNVEKNSGSTKTSISGTTTNTQSGTDTTNQENTSKTQTNLSGTTTGTETNTQTESGTDTITETTIEQGNIGVTTTQRMIQEERTISDFSIIAEYLQDIANNISLQIYKI